MKKVFKIIIILLLVVPLTSCWDSQDLEQLLIVYGIGIDASEANPGQYVFTIGFPTIIEEAPEMKYQISTEARSLNDSKNEMQQMVYRKISYGNTRVIVFGEDAAKQGIMRHIDAMLREPIFPGTTRFAVSNVPAKELYQIEPPVSLFVSTYLFQAIQQSHFATQVPFTTLRNFHYQYYTSGIEPILPSISYSPRTDAIKVACVALFNGDRLVYTLKHEYSRYLMILKGEINSGFYTTEFEDDTALKGFVGIHFTGGSSKIKTELKDKDSTLVINQTINIKSNLAESTSGSSVFDKKKIEEIEEFLSQHFEEKLLETVEKLQDLKTDSVGYGLYAKADLPEFFNGDTWNEDFSKAIVNIDVKVKINTVGITH